MLLTLITRYLFFILLCGTSLAQDLSWDKIWWDKQKGTGSVYYTTLDDVYPPSPYYEGQYCLYFQGDVMENLGQFARGFRYGMLDSIHIKGLKAVEFDFWLRISKFVESYSVFSQANSAALSWWQAVAWGFTFYYGTRQFNYFLPIGLGVYDTTWKHHKIRWTRADSTCRVTINDTLVKTETSFYPDPTNPAPYWAFVLGSSNEIINLGRLNVYGNYNLKGWMWGFHIKTTLSNDTDTLLFNGKELGYGCVYYDSTSFWNVDRSYYHPYTNFALGYQENSLDSLSPRYVLKNGDSLTALPDRVWKAGVRKDSNYYFHMGTSSVNGAWITGGLGGLDMYTDANGYQEVYGLGLCTSEWADAVFGTGTLNRIGTTELNFCGKWNDTTWSALGTGFDAYGVNCFSWERENLIAFGGGMTVANGVTVSSVALWDGNTFSRTTGTTAGAVYSFGLDSAQNLLAGGTFTSVNGLPNTKGVARWNGTSWSSIGGGIDNIPWSFTWFKGKLYATCSDSLRVYSGGKWTAVLGTNGGCCIYSSAVNLDSTKMYITGNNIVFPNGEYDCGESSDGTTWVGIGKLSYGYRGEGIGGYAWGGGVHIIPWEGYMLFGGSFRLAVDNKGNVTNVGGMQALWTGTNWSAMDYGVTHRVEHYAIYHGNLIICGDMLGAGGLYSQAVVGRYPKYPPTEPTTLSLSKLAMWLKWNEGLTITGGTVRKWESINGAPSWIGQPTAGSRPTLDADSSILFDSVDDAMYELDVLSPQQVGSAFYQSGTYDGNWNSEWTILVWVKNVTHYAQYVGVAGINGYVNTGYREYTDASTLNPYIWFVGEDGLDYTLGAGVGLYSHFGEWHLYACTWRGSTEAMRMYEKDKSKVFDVTRAVPHMPYNNCSWDIILDLKGRAVRHAVIFKRALSNAEIDLFFDNTIGDIP